MVIIFKLLVINFNQIMALDEKVSFHSSPSSTQTLSKSTNAATIWKITDHSTKNTDYHMLKISNVSIFPTVLSHF